MAQLALHIGPPATTIMAGTTGTGAGASYAVPPFPGEGRRGTIVWEVITACTALTAVLQGSLDNSRWFPLDSYITAAGGNALQVAVNNPVNFVRANVTATDGGATSVAVQL
jgi:hypothetical protein